VTAEAVARAFDQAAATYDDTWGTNPVGLLFRRIYQERLAARFVAGQRVLDLGCGTGEDALFLSARGIAVGAVDASAAMIARASEKVRRRGPGGTIDLVQGSIETLAGFEPGWDGACSNFGALNCADTAAVGRRLALLLRRGAPVVFSVMARSPLPAAVYRALRGRGSRRRDGDVSVGGIPVPVRYPRLADLCDSLGAAFRWERAAALGVCVPDPGQYRWVEAHPQAFGLLAMAERVVRTWPVLRTWGDHLVIEGVRT